MWVTEVPIYHHGRVAFVLVFYNCRASEFMYVPGGAAPIIAALEKRGFSADEYTTNPFVITERRVR